MGRQPLPGSAQLIFFKGLSQIFMVISWVFMILTLKEILNLFFELLELKF